MRQFDVYENPSISELGVVTRMSLKAHAGDVMDLETEIRRALDRLFTGF